MQNPKGAKFDLAPFVYWDATIGASILNKPVGTPLFGLLPRPALPTMGHEGWTSGKICHAR